jgi:hypothetical protein
MTVVVSSFSDVNLMQQNVTVFNLALDFAYQAMTITASSHSMKNCYV